MNQFAVHARPDTYHLLQVYRGIAATMVLLFHATLTIKTQYDELILGGLFSWGFSGVHLFFVLSGFIICLIHYDDIGNPRRAARYLYNRFTRIYPVYWLVLLVAVPAYLSSMVAFNPYHILDNVTLIRISPIDKIMAVAWTLSHEILFYGAFLILILHRMAGLAFLMAWLALIVVGVITGDVLKPPYLLSSLTGIDYGTFTSFVRLMSNPINMLFALGALCFLIVRALEHSTIRTRIAEYSLAVGLALFLASCGYWLASGKNIIDWASFNAAFGVAAFFMVLGIGSARVERWASGQAFLLFLGDASYSIYLIHYGLQKWMAAQYSNLGGSNRMALFVALIVIPLVIGLLVHKLVEAPILRAMKRRRAVPASNPVTVPIR